MKYIIALFTLLVTSSSYADWSSFAVVKPDTEEKYNIAIDVESKSDGKCVVRFNAIDYQYKHAWLLLVSKSLSLKEQELRSYIWGSSKAPVYLVYKTKISPHTKGLITEENIDASKYEIVLTKQNTNRQYIYIDFPKVARDGGYYYSIDVGGVLWLVKKC